MFFAVKEISDALKGPYSSTYIPFDQAARHDGLSKKVLTQEIQAGKIQAVQLPSGDLLDAVMIDDVLDNMQSTQQKEHVGMVVLCKLSF